MKKVIAAAGLAVLSTASVRAQYAPGLTPLETSKPWSLSATVRGFYDDNYLTLPKTTIGVSATGAPVAVHPASSWGTEVTPGVAVNHSAENTLLSASYIYDMSWYDNGSNTIYQTHQFNGNLQHEFSDRYKLSLAESFAIAQEPQTLVAQNGPEAGVAANPYRVSGSNIRNTGQADFTASLTKLFDLHLGYGNTLYAYQQITRSVEGYPFFGPAGPNAPYYGSYGSVPAVPSYSDLLDRIEQTATLDVKWKATPETTGILGYQYGHTDYTSPGYIIYPYGGPYQYFNPTGGASSGYHSDIRNVDSHFGFVGADESFTPELNGSIRLGAEYLDYYNYDTTRVSPYVDASLTYQYLPGDSVQLGVKHIHNATDVAGFAGTTPVLDEESTVIYVSDTHKLTEKLTFTAMGQAQLSTFVGGGSSYDGRMDEFFVLQVNFAYHFNPWLTTEAGYNFSKLNSDLQDRSYTRDVMYLGLRAVY